MYCKWYEEAGLHSWNILARRYSIQAGLILCDIFLHDFALTQLKNVHHFSNLCIIFGSTQFGTDNPWLHLSSIGG